MTTDPRAVLAAGVVALVIGVVGLVVVLSDSPATDAAKVARPSAEPGPPVRQPEQAPPLSEKITGDGVVVVGKHVKRGTYRTAGGPRCTWARLTDLTGEPGSSVDRGRATDRAEVDLPKGVVGFETHGCPEWVMVR